MKNFCSGQEKMDFIVKIRIMKSQLLTGSIVNFMNNESVNMNLSICKKEKSSHLRF